MSIGSGFSHPPVCGTTSVEYMTDRYRVLKVDANGRLEVVTAAGAPLAALIYGYAGDGTTAVAYRNYLFRPQNAGTGFRQAVGAVSARIGPLTVNKHYQFWSSTVAWINIGGNAVVAASGDFPIAANAVYTYIPYTSYNYIAIIQDTAAGVLYCGRAEN